MYAVRTVRGWAGRPAGVQVRPLLEYQGAGVPREVAIDSAGYALGQLSEYAAMAKRDGADAAQNDEIRREGDKRHRRER